MITEDKIFKILTIDGGGIKGLYTLYILNEIEKQYCIPNNKLLGDYFDMISGCSIGSLIGIGISLRIEIQQIINIFEKNINNIFDINDKNYFIKTYKIIYHKIKQLFGYKYNNILFKYILKKILFNKKISDLNNYICIPSYNISTSSNIVFKSNSNDFLIDIIMCSSAAPTYFPLYKYNKNYYIDGGIWANDPGFITVIETLKKFVGSAPDKLYNKYKILSVSNFHTKNNLNNLTTDYFNICNIEDLCEIILNSNTQSSKHFTDVICSITNGQIIRIFNNDNIKIELDGNTNNNIKLMKELAIKDYNKNKEKISIFFEQLKTLDIKKID